MNCLILLLAITMPGVQVEQQNNSLIFLLPELEAGEHYAHVWITPEPLSDPVWLSPNSLQIVSDVTEGTISLGICGPDYCRSVDYTWAAQVSVPRQLWNMLVEHWVASTVVGLLLIWGIIKTFVRT